MADKKIFYIIVALAIVVSGMAWAADVSYPILELGNCGYKEECKSFCDDFNNQDLCMNWAGKSGMIEQERVQKFEKVREMERGEASSGPGGCSGRQECDMYCSDESHAEECLQFSEKQGFIKKEEVQKVRQIIEKGGPGGCKNKEECDTFCKDSANHEICIADAVKNGGMMQEEADFLLQMKNRQKEREAKKGKKPQGPEINKEKAQELMQKQDFQGPGGCKNDMECKQYCDNFEHMEECMNFAIQNGLMPKEQGEKMLKMSKMAGPGGCKGREECEAYCDQDGHEEECFNFTKESGIMSQEQVVEMEKEMRVFRNMKDKGGPGGCKTSLECNAFCNNPSNSEACFQFSVESGFMTQEEVDKMKTQTIGIEERMRQMEQEGQIRRQREIGDCPNGQCEQNESMPDGGFLNRMFDKEGNMPKQGFVPIPGEQGEFRPSEGMMPGQMPLSPDNNYGGPMPPQGYEGYRPPEGMMPPEGFMQPIESFMPPTDFMPPATESFIPSSQPVSVPAESLPAIGSIFWPILNLFQIY